MDITTSRENAFSCDRICWDYWILFDSMESTKTISDTLTANILIFVFLLEIKLIVPKIVRFGFLFEEKLMVPKIVRTKIGFFLYDDFSAH